MDSEDMLIIDSALRNWNHADAQRVIDYIAELEKNQLKPGCVNAMWECDVCDRHVKDCTCGDPQCYTLIEVKG